MTPAKAVRGLLRKKGEIRVVAVLVRVSPTRTVEQRVSKADALRLLADLPGEELVSARRCDVVSRTTGEVLHPLGWLELGLGGAA